jgi:hypothetical protein
MTLIRDRRTTVAILLSLLICIWCIGAAQSDNRRWIGNLHKGHQSGAFYRAVDQLNERHVEVGKLDQCSVCHEPRNWAINLVDTMEPVSQLTCQRCHQRTPTVPPGVTAAPAKGGDATHNALWIPYIGSRTVRRGHTGKDFPGRVSGLAIRGDGRLDCAECHPEHEANRSVDRVKVEDKIERLRLTRPCLPCHLPTAPSAPATSVLKAFAKAHQSGNGFSPPIPDAAMKAIQGAPEDRPLDRGAQEAAVRDILDVLGKQADLLDQPAEPNRGCTPGCHGEHTPATQDASTDKYKLEPEKKETRLPSLRVWQPLRRG